MPDFDATTPTGQSDSPSASLPADVRSLDLPAHYVVEAEIGRGGAGSVLRAHDTRHDRKVAIKVLRREIAQDFGADRFLREIRTAAQLVHPHIVSVFDSGAVAGTLYYVMPYIEGESLRARLDRSGPLPIDEAVRIAREIASALECAHEVGIVHRDIKPENILLSRNGHAWLADFGIARVSAGASTRLTQTGQVVGSPLYLSPEQARDDKHVDHRSDVYSLGCVLYEMLAGAPAFAAGSMHAVLLKHLTRMPARLQERRPAVPEQLDETVQVALAKNPADRFQTIREFAAELGAIHTPHSAGGHFARRALSARRRRALARGAWLAAATIPIGVVMVVSARSDAFNSAAIGRLFSSGVTLDTMRYVVLPFVVDASVPQIDPENRLRDALAAWRELDVIAARAAGSEQLSRRRDLVRVARAAKAGRLITGEISAKGDSLRVYVELRDGAAPEVRLARQKLAFRYDTRRLDVNFAALSNSLLFQGLAPQCFDHAPGTSSISAIHACDAAFSALEDGQTARADSFFQKALQADATYGRAALWLGQVRTWLAEKPVDAEPLLSLAFADSTDLSLAERRIARGMSLLHKEQFAAACREFAHVIAADSLDFAAWLGLGECRRRDGYVIRAPRIGVGWTFRSSYARALDAYARAFELRPTLMAAYRAHSFLRLRELFLTSATTVRQGRALAPDTATFVAYAELDNDSLAFFPEPTADFATVKRGVPATLQSAADRQRDRLKRLAERWAALFPESVAAREALAVALELDGDATAIEYVRTARMRAVVETERFSLAAKEIWLRVKFGLPDNTEHIRTATALADSLLRNSVTASTEQHRVLAALAVLLGRPAQGARLIRLTASAAAQAIQLPAAVVEPARALMIFASAGAPLDSLRAVESEFERALANTVPRSQQQFARVRLLTQPAMVAFPAYRFESFGALAPAGLFTSAEEAYARRDSAAVRRMLRQVQEAQAGMRDADVSIDGAFVEAWLWAAVGDSAECVRRLDRALNAVRWFPPGRVDDVIRTGTLMRAIVLRAEMAAAQGDRKTARRWALPVSTLWAGAERALQPTVLSLKRSLN